MSNFIEAKNFLNVICVPAELEITFMSKDVVREWKLKNITDTIALAKNSFDHNLNSNETINPKVALSIMENVANEHENEIQELWAGLFVASISSNPSDENLIYSNILKQLTLNEAKIIKFMCENTTVHYSPNGLLTTRGESLFAKTGFKDIIGSCSLEYLESLFTHIHSLNLNIIRWGTPGEVFRFSEHNNDYVLHLIPTVLCLNLYIRCIGFKGSVSDYFNK